jgi:preprotein translocase subunit SecY
MLESFVNIFRIPELRRRVFVTLGLLVVWRLGVHIPIPGVDSEKIRTLLDRLTGEGQSVLAFLNVFSGGAIANAGVFALGIMPYISASIIFSLLIKIVPSLEAIAKEGPAGYRKINQYTRLATVPLCIVQSLYAIGIVKSMGLVTGGVGWGFAITTIFALTAGTMFVMWLGEQITEYGLGNGASLIIMAGIVDRLPTTIVSLLTKHQEDVGGEKVVFLLALYVLVVIGIVFTTQAQRRIPTQQQKHVRGRRIAMMGRHYLPFRLNQANVMPVIFASAIMVLPLLLFGWLGKLVGLDLAGMFRQGQFLYILGYVLLIFFFSYFWVFLMYKPDEIANNLKEYGSFIPGIRPGHKTAEYLEFIFNRITLVGAGFLCLVALLPDLVSAAMGLERYFAAFLGGTGILIVVGVGLDLIQKMESHLLMRHYSGFLGPGSGRIRGRLNR